LWGVIPGLNAVISFRTRSYASGTNLLWLVDLLIGGNVDAGIYQKSEIFAAVYRDEAKGMAGAKERFFAALRMTSSVLAW
jgi:hypothetical protein